MVSLVNVCMAHRDTFKLSKPMTYIKIKIVEDLYDQEG